MVTVTTLPWIGFMLHDDLLTQVGVDSLFFRSDRVGWLDGNGWVGGAACLAVCFRLLHRTMLFLYDQTISIVSALSFLESSGGPGLVWVGRMKLYELNR